MKHDLDSATRYLPIRSDHSTWSLLAKDRSTSAAAQADLAMEQEALLELNCLAEGKKKCTLAVLSLLLREMPHQFGSMLRGGIFQYLGKFFIK